MITTFVCAGAWPGGAAKLGLRGSTRHGLKRWPHRCPAVDPWARQALSRGLGFVVREVGAGTVVSTCGGRRVKRHDPGKADSVG